MNLKNQQIKLNEYIQDNDLNNALILDHVITVQQEPTIKYERIEKYRILYLKGEELTGFMKECLRLDLCVWFGADKLCIGYNHRRNMRLSAYSTSTAPCIGEVG